MKGRRKHERQFETKPKKCTENCIASGQSGQTSQIMRNCNEISQAWKNMATVSQKRNESSKMKKRCEKTTSDSEQSTPPYAAIHKSILHVECKFTFYGTPTKSNTTYSRTKIETKHKVPSKIQETEEKQFWALW